HYEVIETRNGGARKWIGECYKNGSSTILTWNELATNAYVDSAASTKLFLYYPGGSESAPGTVSTNSDVQYDLPSAINSFKYYDIALEINYDGDWLPADRTYLDHSDKHYRTVGYVAAYSIKTKKIKLKTGGYFTGDSPGLLPKMLSGTQKFRLVIR